MVFALDQINYACWIPIPIRDMKSLSYVKSGLLLKVLGT